MFATDTMISWVAIANMFIVPIAAIARCWISWLQYRLAKRPACTPEKNTTSTAITALTMKCLNVLFSLLMIASASTVVLTLYDPSPLTRPVVVAIAINVASFNFYMTLWLLVLMFKSQGRLLDIVRDLVSALRAE